MAEYLRALKKEDGSTIKFCFMLDRENELVKKYSLNFVTSMKRKFIEAMLAYSPSRGVYRVEHVLRDGVTALSGKPSSKTLEFLVIGTEILKETDDDEVPCYTALYKWKTCPVTLEGMLEAFAAIPFLPNAEATAQAQRDSLEPEMVGQLNEIFDALVGPSSPLLDKEDQKSLPAETIDLINQTIDTLLATLIERLGPELFQPLEAPEYAQY